MSSVTNSREKYIYQHLTPNYIRSHHHYCSKIYAIFSTEGLGRFEAWDVLQLRPFGVGTFWGLGHFGPWDVLWLGTFWGWDVLELGRFGAWDVLRLGCSGVGTFYRWDLMQWDLLQLGRFVGAPRFLPLMKPVRPYFKKKISPHTLAYQQFSITPQLLGFDQKSLQIFF